MKDLLDRNISAGSIVMYADGNARYGGLFIRFGKVIELTDKTIKLDTCVINDDKPKYKTVTKRTNKLFLVNDQELINKINETLRKQ